MTWLTTKQVSKLLGKKERTVQLAKSEYQYRYVNGVGRGGRVLQLALESLPQSAQDKYHNVNQDPAPILQYTRKQREEADSKAWAVVQYQQSGLSPEAFIPWYNAEYEPEKPLNRDKLFRWQRKYQQGGVAALIDQRGGHDRESSLSDDSKEWQLFNALYMTQQKRSVRLCYDITKMEYPDIPSVSAFERKVREIPKYALLYYREGPKAANDLLPSMERSRLDIASNDIWFSDHHLLDVFVKSEDGQRIIRPWITAFFDARSNKVVSFVVRNADPNATVIKKCFRLGVERHGVPSECYFDNGRDYRSKYFSRDYPMSLVNQLGIGMIYATAYHGQAKTVERFFGTLTNRFSRRFETYTGQNAKARPECMQTTNKNILPLAPDFSVFIEQLTAYIAEYNDTPSRGIDMGGKSPNEVYSTNLKTVHVVRNHDALRLLCGNSEERTVHKSGVTILNNSYFHELLLSHLGERVSVVYDPDNIDKVSVFDTVGQAICTAEARIRTPFRHTTEEDYIRAAKEKKAARAVYKRYKPVRDVDIHGIIARNQLMEKAFMETGEPSVIEHITPQAARNAEILRDTDTASRRIPAEESISAVLLREYQKNAIGG